MSLISTVSLLQQFVPRMDFEKPLIPQLHSEFVPAFVGEGAVSRKSLHGRLSVWFTPPSSKKKQQEKIKGILAKAVKQFLSDREATKDIPIRHRIALYQELSKEISAVTPHEFSHAEELEEMKKSAQESKNAQDQQEYAKSLFRLPVQAPALNDKQFEDLFKINSQMSPQQFDAYFQFLQRNPSFAHSKMEIQAELLKGAKKFSQELQDTFFKEGKPLAQEKFLPEMTAKATMMSGNIQGLNEGDSLMFCGSYGPKQIQWTTLYQLLKKLPQQFWDYVPASISKNLLAEKMPDPNAIVDKFLDEAIEKLSSQIPQGSMKLDFSFLSPLLKDETRQIPNLLASLLPESMQNRFNQKMQDGILENLASVLEMAPEAEVLELIQFILDQRSLFQGQSSITDAMPLGVLSHLLALIPRQNAVGFFRWFSKYAHLLNNPEKRQKFISDIRSQAMTYFGDHQESALEIVNYEILKLLRSFQSVLPDFCLQFSGIEKLLPGSFWLQFERQPNGLFTVLVYGSGSAGRLHPTNPNTGKICWPLRIEDVAQEKLTPDFFQRVLYHHLEPQRDPSVQSSAEDLYEGLIPYLEGTFNTLAQSDWREISLSMADETLLLESLLTSEKNVSGLSILEMHLEGLLSFCQPLLSGNKHELEIKDPAVCSLLEKAVKKIGQEANELNKHLSKEKKEQIEYTCKEVLKAIQTYRLEFLPRSTIVGENPLEIPQKWLEAIHQVMQKNGLKVEHLQSVKETLVWALGDDVEEFIDNITDSLESIHFVPGKKIPSAVSAQALNAKEKGWLRSILRSAQYHMVLETLKVMSNLLKLYQFGCSPIALARLLSKGLDVILPAPIREWYHMVLGRIQRALMEMALKAVIGCLISKEDMEKLHVLGDNWKEVIRKNIALLKEGKNLDFNTDLIPHENTTSYDLFFGLDTTPLTPAAQNSSKRVDLPNPKSFPIVFEPKMALKASTALETLESWNQYAIDLKKESAKSPTALLYLIHKFEDIEIPQRDAHSLWEEIPENEIPAYLETLAKLGETLKTAEYSVIHLLNLNESCIANYMCAKHNLLAITDRLARRSPDFDCGDVPMHVTDLLMWLTSKYATIEDPRMVLQLKKIVAYFVPEIDFEHLPDEEQINLIKDKSLFSFTQYDWELIDDTTMEKKLFPKKVNDKNTLFHYFLTKLKDPTFLAKCEALEIKGWPNQVIVPFKKLTTAEKMRVLLELSMIDDPQNTIFPRSFNLLHKQFLLCNNKSYLQSIDADINNLNLKDLPVVHRELPLPPILSRLLHPFTDYRTDLDPSLPSSFATSKRIALYGKTLHAKTCFELSESNCYLFLEKSVSQSAVMQEKNGSSSIGSPNKDFFNTVLDDSHKTDEFLIAQAEKPDQIVRVLAFFKKHAKTLDLEDLRIKYYLEKVLFRAGDLSSQIQASPEIIDAFIDVWNVLYAQAKFKNDTYTQLWLLFLGHKVQKLTSLHQSEKAYQFPDFALLLNSYDDTSRWQVDLQDSLVLLKALLSPESEKNQNRENAIFQVQNRLGYQYWEFFLGKSYRKNLLSFNYCLQMEWHRQFQPQLFQAHKNENADSKNRHFSFKEIDQTNLNAEQKKTSLLEQVQRTVKSIYPEFESLTFEKEDLLISKDGSFLVLIVQNEFGKELVCSRKIDGKVYYYYPHVEGIFTDMNVWVEETANPIKEVVATSINTFLPNYQKPARYLVQIDPNDKRKFRLLAEHDGKHFVHAVPNESAAAILSPISHVCPLTKVECTKIWGSDQLHSFTLKSLNLKFDVEVRDGKQKAVVQNQFPGFMLADSQKHPALKQFPTYLLLEHSNGSKKVLIPFGQWVESIVWGLLSYLGPVGPLLAPWIREKIQLQTNKTFVDYDLDREGNLVSENPYSIAYLVVISVLQGNMLQAKKACDHFEILARRESFAIDFSDLLIPILLIPFAVPGVSTLRMRLLSAIEEHRRIHADSQKNEPSSLKDFNFYILLFSVLCLDLKKNLENKNSRDRLNEYQEWFLYQMLFDAMRQFLLSFSFQGTGKTIDKHSYAMSFFKNSYTESAIKKMIEASDIESMFSLFGANAQVVKRYQKLKAKMGFKDSFSKSAAIFVSGVAQTANPLDSTSIPSLLPSSNFELVKDLKSTISTALDAGLLNFSDLDLKKLKETCLPYKVEHPPLKLSELTPLEFKKHFLSYYAIAREEGRDEEKQQLTTLLQLMRGGWDPETRLLIQYLETVLAHPLLFWKAKGGEAVVLSDKNEHGMGEIDMPNRVQIFFDAASNEDEFNNFFEHLHSRATKAKVAMRGVSFASKVAAKFYSGGAVLDALPTIDYLPKPRIAMKVLDWGAKLFSKVKNDIQQEVVVEPKALPKQEMASLSYSKLDEEDKQVNDYLQQQFNHAFVEIKKTADEIKNEKRIDLFEHTENDSRLEKAGTSKVNKSIKDYYSNSKRHVSKFRLLDKDNLWDIYFNLTSYRDAYLKQWKNEEQTLLESLNITLSENQKLDIKHLKKAFLDGDFQSIGHDLNLSPETLQRLDILIARHYVKKGRLNQIEGVIQKFKELSQISPNEARDAFEDKVETIAEMLSFKRSYSFGQLPLRLLRGFMVFEAESKVMLWERQVHRMKDLMVDASGSAVLEFLMSLGKTFFGMPMMDFFLGNGERIVFNTYPKQIAATNIRQLSVQGKEVFEKLLNVLHCDRKTPLKKDNLQAILVVLQRAKENKETINMTKEDAQSLEIRFLEALYDQLNPRKNASQLTEDEILLLRDILQLFRTLGFNVGDEAHELFRVIQELNYPLGDKSKIAPLYYAIIEQCMRCLSKDKTFMELIKANDLNKLPIKEYEQTIRERVAAQMSMYPAFKLRGDANKRKEFVDYVCERIPRPQWLQEEGAHGKEIDMVKGTISPLLRMVVSRVADVNFGDSGRGFADPFEGNMNYVTDSSIRLAYETLVKTFAMYLYKGLTILQTKQLLFHLSDLAQKESTNRKIKIQETKAFKTIRKLIPNFDELDVPKSSKSDLDQIFKDPTLIEKLSNDSEVGFAYVKYFIWKKISYWKLNLCSNAQNFHSMFSAGWYQTGTPYNDGSYPADAKMLWDPGTIGEALHIIFNKCPKDGIHALEKSSPKEILDEVLQKYFAAGSNFTALIDGGAQLKGIKGVDVAKKMLEHCDRSRPDIKAVVYFEKDAQGKDLLVYLAKGETQSKPFDQCTIKPEAYLSYFDQSHGFAANIPQKDGKAIGLNLVGRNNTLFRECQEDFRMRGLKKWKRLESTVGSKDSDPLEGVQQIHFAMTKDVQSAISGGNRLPTRKEIFKYAVRNESNEVGQDNYQAYRQKAANVIRRAILDKMYASSSVAEMKQILKEFQDVIITTIPDDPETLYGGFVKKAVPDEKVFKKIKDGAYAPIKDSHRFSKEEKKAHQLQLDAIPIPIMPDTVDIVFEGENLKIDLLDHTGKEVTHEQDQDIDQNREIDQDLNLELNQKSDFSHSEDITNFEEWEWPEDLDAYSTAWQNVSTPDSVPTTFSKIKKKLAVGQKSTKATSAPPVFRFQNLFEGSARSIFKKVAKSFDYRLWCTNNFLPMYVKNIFEYPVQLCSKAQRDVFEVLVDVVESENGYAIQSVGCLSVKEASEFWRKKLSKEQKGPIKRVLYDVALGKIVAGHGVNSVTLRDNVEFKQMEVQLKFLNGDVKYSTEQLLDLEGWLKEQNLHDMHLAFETIHMQRGKEDYEGSDIHILFEKLFDDLAIQQVQQHQDSVA